MSLQLYENEKFGFSIKYPGGWDILKEHPLSAVAMFSPKEEDSDFRVEIFINVIDLCENPKTLEKMIEETPSQLEVFLGEFRIYEQINTILGGKKAFQIIYSGKMKIGRQKNIPLKHMQISTFRGDIYYSIGFSHGFDYFESYLDLFSKMSESFQFT